MKRVLLILVLLPALAFGREIVTTDQTQTLSNKTFDSTCTIEGSIAGNAATATALATNPTDCASNRFATSVDTGANLTCSQVDISTSAVTGILPNANTTAASANTASAIVARDASGNFTAGTVTGALTGNSSTATALAANPAACTATQFATDIAANGTLTCAAPTYYSILLGRTVVALGNDNTTRWFSASGSATAGTAETDFAQVLPVAITVDNLQCQITIVPGGTATRTFTLRKSQSSQTLTCTVTAAAGGCSDTTHSFAAAAGTYLTIQSDAANTPAAAFASCGVRVTM